MFTNTIKPKPKPKTNISHSTKIANAEEVIPLTKVDPLFAKKIIETRIHKKLSRKQLAQLLSIPEVTLAECEKCGNKPGESIMNKLHNYVNKNHPDRKN